MKCEVFALKRTSSCTFYHQIFFAVGELKRKWLVWASSLKQTHSLLKENTKHLPDEPISLGLLDLLSSELIGGSRVIESLETTCYQPPGTPDGPSSRIQHCYTRYPSNEWLYNFSDLWYPLFLLFLPFSLIVLDQIILLSALYQRLTCTLSPF